VPPGAGEKTVGVVVVVGVAACEVDVCGFVVAGALFDDEELPIKIPTRAKTTSTAIAPPAAINSRFGSTLRFDIRLSAHSGSSWWR
jgi:hypothetical protein